MTSLKAEPAGPVRSLEELFAIAHAMECDAVARYTETAAQLRQQGAAQLAGVFDRLADVERGHVHQVTVWAERSERPEPSIRSPDVRQPGAMMGRPLSASRRGTGCAAPPPSLAITDAHRRRHSS